MADFAGAIRRSLAPKEAPEVKLIDDQLAMARSATLGNLYAMPVVAALLSVTEYGALPLWRLAVWPVLLIVGGILSELYHHHLQRHADHSRRDVGRRARAMARITLLFSIMWCGMAYDLYIPGNVSSEAILFTALACSLAGWSAMGGYHLATAVAPMPAYLLTLTAMPLAGGQHNGWVLSIIAVAFWAIMRTHLISNYLTRERMLRLEHEREGLIDGLKAAKDESDGARERAELASQAKSAFLANMSHELRTPLNAILGFSEIISTRAMGPSAIDQYSEYAGYIHGSGEHLLSLINDILDLAKIEAGRLVLRESEIDLRVLMDDTAKMMGAKAIAGGVSFAVHVERSFPNLLGDERALRQILVNLSSNAIKFTPPGGRVTAFAGVLPEGSLAFGLDDTGIGIAAEEHAKVFESFGQGRHDAILADKGTGLGLPIVKGLAEAHGGYVMLNSTPNLGTRITIVLPPERARRRLRAAS